MAYAGAIAAAATVKKFRCGICGQQDHSHGPEIPQCPVCHVPLCRDCNTYGFCPEHFHQLSPRAQSRVQVTYTKTRVARLWLMAVGMIPLLFLGIFFFLRGVGGFPTSGQGFTGMVIVAILGVLTAVMAVIVKWGRTKRTYEREVARILAQPTSSRGDLPASIPEQFCPLCGVPLEKKARFCPECGADLA